jgi:tRNA(Ile)-lysidine synthase
MPKKTINNAWRAIIRPIRPTMQLLEAFLAHAARHGLCHAPRPVLLALSGGLDSVVLADLLRAADWPFAVAHCNFQLRGTESEGDAAFAEAFASELGVPFHLQRFDTQSFAAAQGCSIQMAARQLRYHWFAALCTENNYAATATAHHLNDAVETALLNFARGTGLRGMGMDPTPGPSPQGRGGVFAGVSLRAAPRENADGAAAKAAAPLPWGEGPGVGSLIRPLLFASRAEILAYAEQRGLRWREDSSNADEHYARNFVRHQIMPRFEQLNPDFLRTAARNLETFRHSYENLLFLLKNAAETAPAAPGGPVFSLQKAVLARLPHPAQALRELLRPFGFRGEQARQLAENLTHTGLQLRSPDGQWLALVERQAIQVHATAPAAPDAAAAPPLLLEPDDLMRRLPDGGRLFVTDAAPEPPYPDGREAVCVDAGKLQFPLQLRHWVAGDWFQPFGMGGQAQKLQDFFTNQKLSRQDKARAWLLLNGDGAVIWVLGWRLDERFRVGPQTRTALRITWSPPG